MNERDMTDLLQGATRDLSPDVTALVAGGIRRGQVRRRRRRTATVLAAAAAVALVGIGGARLLDLDDGSSRGIQPAAPVPSATPSATSTATDSDPPARADLAVTTAQVPQVFASLVPGEVSAPGPKSGPDSAPVVDFTWEGFGVRVGLTPDDYVAGHRVLDPGRRCAAQTPPAGCSPGPNGTVISTSDATNPDVDGGTRVRSVNVFRPDGWDVLVMVYNGPAKDGPVLQDEPPLDLGELERVASSDAWFR